MKTLTNKQANNVYDLLVKIGGAVESDRSDFVYNHTTTEYPCNEYRFQGHFGFGGKYWVGSNRVTFYRENGTPKLEALKEELNLALQNISDDKN